MVEIPGYEIVEKLGRSSMTDVWKAYQSSLERYVTIKVLREEFAADPQEVERFFAEARQTSSIKHPGVLQIFNADEHDGHYYVVMEFVNGPSVDELIQHKGALPPRWSMGVAAQAARALGYAWKRHQLVHRNLTPRSLFPNGKAHTKIAYLGLSLRVAPGDGSVRLRPGMIVGTPYYMSPEQACCSPDLDFRTDMYSLGASLYHMITGRMPFAKYEPVEALRKQVDGQLMHPSRHVEGLPTGMAFVMRKLMMKDPQHRYATWEDAARALEKLAAGKVLVSRGRNGHASTVRELRVSAKPAARRSVESRRPRNSVPRQLAQYSHPGLRRILA
jgi:serine/threonine-protein kinase